MKIMLAASAISLALLSGAALAQSTSGTSGAPGVGSTDKPSTVKTPLRSKRTFPSVASGETESIMGGATLMPSRTLGDEPYSSIEPKGTWIGSMGIFKRSLLNRRTARTRRTGLSSAPLQAR